MVEQLNSVGSHRTAQIDVVDDVAHLQQEIELKNRVKLMIDMTNKLIKAVE